MTIATVARVTEISAASPESFDDAVKVGIERATRTLKNVEGAWVKEMKVVVTGGQVTEYRVSLQVTFILDD
jgi:flavin-binding protein dodecin